MWDIFLPARQFRWGDVEIKAELLQIFWKAKSSDPAISVGYKGGWKSPPVVDSIVAQFVSKGFQGPLALQGLLGEVRKER